MFLRELDASLDHIRGVGRETVKTLAKLGIYNAGALLSHYPRDWEDRGKVRPLAEYAGGDVCTVVTILAHEWFGFGRTRTLKIHIEDESAQGVLVCFNRPFLGKQFPVGTACTIYGKFQYKYGDIQSTAFNIAGTGREDIGAILPIYPLTEGLTQTTLRRLMKTALELYAGGLENELPAALMGKERLLQKNIALKAIHFPLSIEQLDTAKRTLIYEELFYLEILVGKRALARKGYQIPDNERERSKEEVVSSK